MNSSSRLVLCSLLVAFGCSVHPAAPEKITVEVEVLEWRTEGGGNLYFDVRRTSAKEFTIVVFKRNFQEENAEIRLTRDRSLPVYDLLDWVFCHPLQAAGSTPVMGETGTWTSVYVVDPKQQRQKIATSQPPGDLHSLRYWVEDQLTGSKPAATSNDPAQ